MAWPRWLLEGEELQSESKAGGPAGGGLGTAGEAHTCAHTSGWRSVLYWSTYAGPANESIFCSQLSY